MDIVDHLPNEPKMCAPETLNCGAVAGLPTQIPYSTKQGIISAEQGILKQEQGILPIKRKSSGPPDLGLSERALQGDFTDCFAVLNARQPVAGWERVVWIKIILERSCVERLVENHSRLASPLPSRSAWIKL